MGLFVSDLEIIVFLPEGASRCFAAVLLHSVGSSWQECVELLGSYAGYSPLNMTQSPFPMRFRCDAWLPEEIRRRSQQCCCYPMWHTCGFEASSIPLRRLP